MTRSEQPSLPRNRLLAALPPASLARLRPRLKQVELPLRRCLQEPDIRIETVYFLESGWVSMVARLAEGDSAEVGIIGREGMVGLPVLLDAESDDLEGMVQCEGSALSLDSASLREARDADPALRGLLLRFALAHHGQVARTGACNVRHAVVKRLARWLLMAHDRSEEDGFPMTHEFLSMMLGIRRAGITVAAGRLQRAGLIRYDRGQVVVTDRPGLENASCECYAVVRRGQQRLLGPAADSRDRLA